MNFGSVCSGIEAASVAFNPLGWKAVWFSEIEKFPSAVLKERFPDIPNLGDLRKLPTLIKTGAIEAPEFLCGGTPCQAFSVAGLRKSLSDDRGNLSLTFCELADEIQTVRLIQHLPPPQLSYGKTSPECSAQEITPSGACWLDYVDQTFPLQYRTRDGRTLVLLPEKSERLHGEYSTLNISECPNNVRESSLSQVLEKSLIPPKYFLSIRACAGILARAHKRKKELPHLLKEVLEDTVNQNQPEH